MRYLSGNTIVFLWDFLKHPVTALVVGFVMAVIPYVPSRSGKELYYSISSEWEGFGMPQLLTIKSDDKKRVRSVIYFNQISTECEPKRSHVPIALWNAGSSPIKTEDIATVNPIRIKPSGKVKIDDVMVFKKSRADLEIETYIRPAGDNIEEIVVGIKGGDALEKFDGVGLIVSFIKENKDDVIDWNIVGRLIGNRKVFNSIGWHKIRWKYERSWFPRWVSPISNGFLLFFLSRSLYRHIKRGSVRRLLVFLYAAFLASVCIAAFLTIYEEYSMTAIPFWLYEAQKIAW